MTENEAEHKVIGFTEKSLAVKLLAYEDYINEDVHKLTLHLMKSAPNMTYDDILIVAEAYKAVEDYIIVKRVLRAKCLDDAIYYMVLRDLAELLDDIIGYLMENKTDLKDRIEFRLWLFKRDIYGFIKDCPHFGA